MKKSEPPKFNGNVIEFPEFKRKWKALVSKAGLPEESEVDKLKDAVTKEGKDTLFGATNMDEAWKRLDKIFGDPRIISNQLKTDLKNVKANGKTDAEKIKDLKTKVDILVRQMVMQKCDVVLIHDPEFLSNVFYAMPNCYRREWLKSKVDHTWQNMITFLNEEYDKSS